MAEIRVEPKRKAPIWPWIIGVLILLGLIWLLVEAFDRNDDVEGETRDAIDEAEDEVEDAADEVGSLQGHDEQTLVLHLYRDADKEEAVMKVA